MKSPVCLAIAPEPDARGQAPCASACHLPAAENLCRVVSNRWVNAEYKHLVLQAPPVALQVKPGQFFHLACPASGEDRPYLRRPMSLYRVNAAAGQIEFLYKVQGAGTRGLATLAPDGALDVMGPVGLGFTLPQPCRHVLILARGVGLATMAPLAEFAVAQGAAVTAVLSARSDALLMSVEYLRSVGAQVVAVNDEDGSSSVRSIETLVRDAHARQPFDLMATCGSNRLLQLVQGLSDEWKVPGQVALEQHMGCALGMCFACVRPFRKAPGSEQSSYRRVCWDGPVFDVLETLTW